jgi:hypothetical protein
MIGRLYATHCGAAHCILDAVPYPAITSIYAVLRDAASLGSSMVLAAN